MYIARARTLSLCGEQQRVTIARVRPPPLTFRPKSTGPNRRPAPIDCFCLQIESFLRAISCTPNVPTRWAMAFYQKSTCITQLT